MPRCPVSAVHTRWIVVAGGILGCASTEPPLLVEDVETVEVVSQDRDHAPLVPPVAHTNAPWVWAEAPLAQRSCIVGCPTPQAGAPAAAIADQPLEQSFRAWPADGKLLAARIAPTEQPWQSTLAIDGPRTARALRCGGAVFVVFGAAGDPHIGSWLLDPDDGTTIDQRAIALGVDTRLTAPPQMVCRDGEGIIVSTKQASNDGVELGVYELDGAGRTVGRRTLPGRLADLDVNPIEAPAGPQISAGEFRYDFTRGRRGRTRPWSLHAKAADGHAWQFELGDPDASIGLSTPMYDVPRPRGKDPDAVILEHDGRAIVAFDRRLLALDTEDGIRVWLADLGGYDHLLQRLTRGNLLGLRGCGRCVFPRPQAWIDGDDIVFALSSSIEHYVNVVDAQSGDIVARRIFE